MTLLTPEELLTTTRAVRKRLDLEKPVEIKLVKKCIEIAQQAPTASNRQNWHFLVVTDQSIKNSLSDLFRKGWQSYINSPTSVAKTTSSDDPKKSETQRKIYESAEYLVENLKKVPVFVIPCIEGRTDGSNISVVVQSAIWGSIAPAVWNFMLAARLYGLGTTWTSFHLLFEKEAAELLKIPYEKVMQVALLPLAYYKGDSFKPAPRESVEKIIHIDSW
ncbi:MAG TPA: nitroreductase family protein [Candidatus Nitrosocosmicus sp.]|nr:nitroreductase family protein [Candidatus Nitrosocosmicus sp.]